MQVEKSLQQQGCGQQLQLSRTPSDQNTSPDRSNHDLQTNNSETPGDNEV